MSLRTPLARARGLGSARDGVHHWWMQRVTAVALVPLTIWFVASIVSLAGAGYRDVTDWLGQVHVAALMVFLLGATFHHAALGLQVVIEDYVHDELVKLISLIAMKIVLALLAITSILAVIKVAVTG